MLDRDLPEILEYMCTAHQNVSANFQKEHPPIYNFKKTLVCDVYRDDLFLKYVGAYLEFCGAYSISFDESSPACISRSRVKHINSVQQKLETYLQKENGEIPISKCLNDLFGARYIYEGSTSLEQVKEILSQNSYTMKCRDSTKNGYKGIHIYFNISNTTFQWELQIWNQADSIGNIESHKYYKQDYSKWEPEQKGGYLKCL